MSFCKYSQSFVNDSKVLVDVAFINNFLPKAPDLCVKAYLLGLCACNSEDESTNSLSYFADTLKVCEEDVVSLFKYWEEEGLVQVLSTDPIEIRYLKVQEGANKVKKFKVDKYLDFNIQLQELFNKRMVMPNEFAEFYNLIENRHMEEKAILAIVKYCVDYKGFDLRPSYCLAVAKDWERENIRTYEQVQNKIADLGIVDDNINIVLTALGNKRKIQIEDKELFSKWTKSLGFELNVIVFVVKLLKSKKRHVDINVLDECLTKYYEMKLMSIQEIENYENEKDNLYALAMAVNKELGVFYEDLTKEIDTYIVPWTTMGYDMDTLKLVADNCFKSSIKTLEGLNGIIQKLFKLGIVSTSAYMQYLHDNFAMDEKIKAVLLALNLSRNVNNMDRNFYNVWTTDWNFTDDVILFACELSKDKANAMNYLNKILSNWNTQGLKKLEQVKNMKIDTRVEQNFVHNNYTTEQISSLISNLDEVEV